MKAYWHGTESWGGSWLIMVVEHHEMQTGLKTDEWFLSKSDTVIRVWRPIWPTSDPRPTDPLSALATINK